MAASQARHWRGGLPRPLRPARRLRGGRHRGRRQRGAGRRRGPPGLLLAAARGAGGLARRPGRRLGVVRARAAERRGRAPEPPLSPRRAPHRAAGRAPRRARDRHLPVRLRHAHREHVLLGGARAAIRALPRRRRLLRFALVVAPVATVLAASQWLDTRLSESALEHDLEERAVLYLRTVESLWGRTGAEALRRKLQTLVDGDRELTAVD